MACYVGMTTNLQRRKREHQRTYPNLRQWKRLGTAYSKTKAQEMESRFARRLKCSSGSGGSGPERATWYIYYFEY